MKLLAWLVSVLGVGMARSELSELSSAGPALEFYSCRGLVGQGCDGRKRGM